jgi:hypothetical protein
MGTVFSLKDPNPGVWFSFDERDPDAGRICVRVINMAKREEIRKATTKKRVEYKNGGRFEVLDFDEDKFSEMLWDYLIADWERLEDDAGIAIECTKENKIKLVREHVGFQAFVNVCIEKINADIEPKQGAILKN